MWKLKQCGFVSLFGFSCCPYSCHFDVQLFYLFFYLIKPNFMLASIFVKSHLLPFWHAQRSIDQSISIYSNYKSPSLPSPHDAYLSDNDPWPLIPRGHLHRPLIFSSSSIPTLSSLPALSPPPANERNFSFMKTVLCHNIGNYREAKVSIKYHSNLKKWASHRR